MTEPNRFAALARALENSSSRFRAGTTNLTDELQGRILNLFFCDRRLKIKQGFDISAHVNFPSLAKFKLPGRESRVSFFVLSALFSSLCCHGS